MRNSVFPLALVFLLGLMFFPIGVKAQMSPGIAEHGMESGLPGYDRPFKSLGEQIYYTGVSIYGPIPFAGGPEWWIAAAVLQGISTAVVYPVLIAAVSDVAHQKWWASSLGVCRLWRDLGYAAGALLAGLIADLLGMGTAIHTVPPSPCSRVWSWPSGCMKPYRVNGGT